MSDIKIGKNAIENLTIGMYQDSKIIYREYIQNATDQIKEADRDKLFDIKLFVDINIDPSKRQITITDNATGIPKDQIKSKLADVADSDKESGIDAGFRGIGRLGGLAYCDKLKFITSSKGEKVKTIMIWDAKKLINMLIDKTVKNDAATVLEQIISYEYEPCSEDEHFFTVVLEGVNQENNELLDIEKVKQYIAMNAPVPYDSTLIFKSNIYKYLKERSLYINEYLIYVNAEIINKPYTTTLKEKSSVPNHNRNYDEIYDIKIEEFKNDKGELLAWMWYGISSFIKCIPLSENPMAGIRLRQSNFQIGDGDTLASLCKDHRDNYYFIGEVHAIHPELIPNARRDYFIENEVRNQFEAELKYYFKQVCRPLFYDANRAKSAYNKDIGLKKLENDYNKKSGKFISDKEKQDMENNIKNAKEESEKGKKEIKKLEEKAQNDSTLKRVLIQVKKNYEKNLSKEGLDKNLKLDTDKNKNKGKNSYLVDVLSKLNKQQKKLVSRIYEVIRKNLPDKESDELINKIQEELKK